MRMWDMLFGRQRQTETGGFQGRANKEADSCYAFWLVRIEPNCPKMLTECGHFLIHYVGVYDLLIIFLTALCPILHMLQCIRLFLNLKPVVQEFETL